jgi:hypothetical protein
MKMSNSDIDVIRYSDEDNSVLAARYGCTELVIYQVKRGIYRMYAVKLFGNKNEIQKVAIEEYVKFFNKEPEKFAVIPTTECVQFWVLPERMIIQVDNHTMREAENFKEKLIRNFKSHVYQKQNQNTPYLISQTKRFPLVY